MWIKNGDVQISGVCIARWDACAASWHACRSGYTTFDSGATGGLARREIGCAGNRFNRGKLRTQRIELRHGAIESIIAQQ